MSSTGTRVGSFLDKEGFGRSRAKALPHYVEMLESLAKPLPFFGAFHLSSWNFHRNPVKTAEGELSQFGYNSWWSGWRLLFLNLFLLSQLSRKQNADLLGSQSSRRGRKHFNLWRKRPQTKSWDGPSWWKAEPILTVCFWPKLLCVCQTFPSNVPLAERSAFQGDLQNK